MPEWLGWALFVLWMGSLLWLLSWGCRPLPEDPEQEERVRVREEERARRGRNRRHAMGRGKDPNVLAPWDAL